MKRRTRRLMLLVAILLFCVASGLVILSAQGYSWNWTLHHFVRSGAISVSVNTDGAQLFIDNRLVGATSLLSDTIGSGGVTPGFHSVRVVKDGWSPWYKNASVSEGFLTSFPAVLIVATDEDSLGQLRNEASRSFSRTPAASDNEFILRKGRLFDLASIASASPLASGVLGFDVTSNHAAVLWWTTNSVWVQWLATTNSQPFRTVGERLMVGRWNTRVKRATWFRDSDHVVIDLGTDGFRIIETDNRGALNVIRF